ncbi:MAG: hypothetical protein Q7T85_03845 [Nitrosomonas sp.]|nr:hypothetical protein [Nitrosomonas sp.]
MKRNEETEVNKVVRLSDHRAISASSKLMIDFNVAIQLKRLL